MKEEIDNWKYLPDLLLEEVYTYLTWSERLPAACTCRSWHETFFSPRLWKSFVYRPPSYLERYSQRSYYDIATINLSKCFFAVGHCFKKITIPPTSDFFILNRALNVIAEFYRRQQRPQSSVLEETNIWDCNRSRLKSLSFEFANHIENGNMYGTGGTLLESIKKLLDTVTDLKEATIKSLLLEVSDQRGLFTSFINHNQNSLRSLSLVDIAKVPVSEYGLIQLRYLKFLELGVCELDADLLIHLVQETSLEVLVLTQTRFTLFSVEFSTMDAISNHVWDLAIEINADLKVHQRYLFNNISEFIDPTTISIIYQPHPAPVTTFLFSSNNSSLLNLYKLDLYHATLTDITVIVDCATESNVRTPIDEELFQVIYNCPHLETLILGGGRLSVHSATILQLLLDGSKKLKDLFIEDNVVQYSFQNMSTDMFNAYLSNEMIAISSDPSLFLANVRSHLKKSSWNLLKSKQFCKLLDKRRFML